MRTVLITGANRGIGLELARLYGERGDTVIACCRDPQNAATLHKLSGVEIHRLDVTSGKDIANLQATLGARPVDVLINNAGVIGPGRQSTLNMDFDGWLTTFDVNTLGPLRIASAVLDNLRRSAAPKIVTLSSRMGSLTGNGGSDRIAYRSSKAATNRAMQGLAADLAGDAVTVVMVHPGWVSTDMGGPGAPLAPHVSAARLIAIIDDLDRSDSGRFIDIDGNDADW
ncbi:MAG: SDR family oxidoreductase [Hyphomicrobiales bacterium]|nr:SDR family oxidoreductase [Hyphomicrobiales bacterium]